MKKLMKSKYGLHMASDPLAYVGITEDEMVVIAQNFGEDADLNGGEVHMALMHFIFKLITKRADAEYEIALNSTEELIAGITTLATGLAARALHDIDIALNEFYDPKRGDHFMKDMLKIGKEILIADAAQMRLYEQVIGLRAATAAKREAVKQTPIQE